MQNNHLFLFEFVRRNSNVIIYGYGCVGKSYIDQIERTKWCHISGIIDKEKKVNNYVNLSMDEITKANADYIVIAIEDIKIATDVYNELIEHGANKNNILNLNHRNGNFPYNENGEKIDNKTIAVFDEGGLGDNLITLLLIKKIKEKTSGNIRVAFYSRRDEYFLQFEFIDESLLYRDDLEWLSQEKKKYTTVISMHNMARVEKVNNELEELEPILYLFCKDNIEMHKVCFENNISRYRYTKYSLLQGKNRLEQADVHDILGLRRDDKIDIPLNNGMEEVLAGYGLEKNGFILINRDEGHDYADATKLWTINGYVELIKLIKKNFTYKIVSIGKNIDSEIRNESDCVIEGQISLNDIGILLKASTLLITCEGGLVHLNHFVGGKSAVIYGPTDPEFFSYPENINIFKGECKEKCCWLTNDWHKQCIKGNKDCMKNVTPVYILEKIRNLLKK